MNDRPKMPWYRWFCSDWLSSETRLGMSLAERGAYRDLLDYHYQEGSIPADTAVLARFLGVGMDEFERLWKRVGPKFRADKGNPGRLVNDKAVKVLAEAEEYRRKQTEHGRLGGRPRKTQPKPNQNPRVISGFALGSEKPKPKHNPNESPHSTPHKKNTARSQANGAARESASPKKPARTEYPEWFTKLWTLYPTDCRGSKKKAFTEAKKLLTCDSDRRQALELLRKRLKHRAALESAGVWLARMKHLEGYIRNELALQDPEEDLPPIPNGSAGDSFAKPLTRAEIEETNRQMRERGDQ